MKSITELVGEITWTLQHCNASEPQLWRENTERNLENKSWSADVFPDASVPEGPRISPSMGKQRNPELALEIHMINTHSKAGGALKFLLLGPLWGSPASVGRRVRQRRPELSGTEQGLCIADLSPNWSNRMQTVGRNYCLKAGVCQSYSLAQIAPILDQRQNLWFCPVFFVCFCGWGSWSSLKQHHRRGTHSNDVRESKVK